MSQEIIESKPIADMQAIKNDSTSGNMNGETNLDETVSNTPSNRNEEDTSIVSSKFIKNPYFTKNLLRNLGKG